MEIDNITLNSEDLNMKVKHNISLDIEDLALQFQHTKMPQTYHEAFDVTTHFINLPLRYLLNPYYKPSSFASVRRLCKLDPSCGLQKKKTRFLCRLHPSIQVSPHPSLLLA